MFSSDPQLLQNLSKDSVYVGHPEFAYISRDWQDTAEALAYAHSHKMPVTFCGSQTSMTGSSVADSGLALSLAAQNKILDISKDNSGNDFAVCEPGVILSDLKEAARAAGFFYPPDPTSFREATLGATVATNATGEDTFKYGPTRWYVDELTVLMANGSEQTLGRGRACPAHDRINNTAGIAVKNTAGYFLGGEEIDEVIGSEGTLCLIKKIKVRLLQNPHDKTFLLLLPFSDFGKAMHAVTEIVERRKEKGDPIQGPSPLSSRLSPVLSGPRALELIGPGAAEYFKKCPECPNELKSENCFLYLKDEYTDDSDYDARLNNWMERLDTVYQAVGDAKKFESVSVAKTDAQLRAIQNCRHYIPMKVNEDFFAGIPAGGGKVGTDWWVPLTCLREMMTQVYEEAQRLQIPFLVFGHIGNGHPHWNFLTRNDAEKKVAIDFVMRQCRDAVRFGGGVAGEHGIGKIKKYLMPIQHAPEMILQMQTLKTKWDPQWILGRGNILVKA